MAKMRVITSEGGDPLKYIVDIDGIWEYNEPQKVIRYRGNSISELSYHSQNNPNADHRVISLTEFKAKKILKIRDTDEDEEVDGVTILPEGQTIDDYIKANFADYNQIRGTKFAVSKAAKLCKYKETYIKKDTHEEKHISCSNEADIANVDHPDWCDTHRDRDEKIKQGIFPPPQQFR